VAGVQNRSPARMTERKAKAVGWRVCFPTHRAKGCAMNGAPGELARRSKKTLRWLRRGLRERVSQGLKPAFLVGLMSGLKPGPISEAKAKASTEMPSLKSGCSPKSIPQRLKPDLWSGYETQG
jgi:hypothetical protein